MNRNARLLMGRIPLFAPFEEKELDALYDCTYERNMNTGEMLIHRGDPGDSMMVILAGKVRIVLPGIDGNDQDLNTLHQGAVFGEIALFDGKPRSADVVAITNGKLLVLERSAVMRLIERDPPFAMRVIEIVCARLRATLTQLDSILFQDVGQRVLAFLIQQSEGQDRTKIDITQSALGRSVGSTRETVNRRLREIEARGLIELSPGRIIVKNLNGLTALLQAGSRIA